MADIEPRAGNMTKIASPLTSQQVLAAATDIQTERSSEYEQGAKGERSMERTVKAFNAITGRTGERALTESDGWLMMQILKDVRMWTVKEAGSIHYDSVVDSTSYSALKGEAVLAGR